MERRIVFQHLVQRDLNEALDHYEEEGGPALADRFFESVRIAKDRILQHPKAGHPISGILRRAGIGGFPYHFVYRETDWGVRVLVLRHDRRHPSYGLRRT